MSKRFSLLLVLFFLFSSIPVLQASAYTWFGGQVTSWTPENGCPYIQTANLVLGLATGGNVLLEYGTLGVKGGFAKPDTLDAGFSDHLNMGVLTVRLGGLVPFRVYQSYIGYGFTQTNSYITGQAFNFTPTCNPCDNDLLKAILKGTAHIDISGTCSKTLVKAALIAPVAACNAALAVANKTVSAMCPTQLLCSAGTSGFGIPSIGINLCSPSISAGGVTL